eukprot:TRINITY_DN9015_c0_g1_i3.p1 TRINITY_DN9015_c0_g1~~TRINITY_DN9015_c0_g1_i3.p1  ORF type:complete len:1211 (-),score=251.10 TRINITY_DN9015_c0_g1_i3:114-3746(-)
MALAEQVTLYIPVHTNLSQVESVVPFIQKCHRAKVFIYRWNFDGKTMQEFYSKFANVEVFDFSLDSFIEQIYAELDKVVILLTSSSNYTFGVNQNNLFGALKHALPSKIIDIFHVGHCLYGCDSCGIREHSIPVYFTRFVNRTLEYSTEDVRRQFIRPGSKSVLIAPSVGAKSFLAREEFINTLVMAQKQLPDVCFVAKLHGFCYSPEGQVSVVHALSPEEVKNVVVIQQNFTVVPQVMFNILPFLDAFDVIITDVDSSVAFESLFFAAPNKRTLAFLCPDYEGDSLYLNHLNTFKTTAELDDSLQRCLRGDLPLDSDAAKAFFESKYGQVTGDEVARISALRNWPARIAGVSAAPVMQEYLPGMPKPSDISTLPFSTALTAARDTAFRALAPFGAMEALTLGEYVEESMLDYASWLNLHVPQLMACGLPQKLWEKLYRKVRYQEVFDGGAVLQFNLDESGYSVTALQDIKANQDIYIVDHAWTFTMREARQQLIKDPRLRERMYALMGLDIEQEDTEQDLADDESGAGPADDVDIASTPVSDDSHVASLEHCLEFIESLGADASSTTSLSYDSKGLTSVAHLQLNAVCPNIESLSLWDNELTDVEDVANGIQGLQRLKGLWLNGNPLHKSGGYQKRLLRSCPTLEILDTKFTPNYSTWAIKEISDCKDVALLGELDLSDRGITELKLDVFRTLTQVHTLDLRNNSLVFSDNVTALQSLRNLISLRIDYEDGLTREAVLEALPQLQFINGVHVSRSESDVDRDEEREIAQLLDKVWLFAQTYRTITDTSDRTEKSIWYVMDELGSRMRHSDRPNFHCAPFFSHARGIAYNLLWPEVDVAAGEQCTRDYLPGVSVKEGRAARAAVITDDEEALTSLVNEQPPQPPLPPSKHSGSQTFVSTGRKLAVHTDMELVKNHLTDDRFTIVENQNDADIIFHTTSFDFDTLRMGQIVNQFPDERYLVWKNLLAHSVKSAYGNVEWFPQSYDLEHELVPFIHEYQRRAEANEDNLWIVKPWKLARGLEITVTDNLKCVVRTMDTSPMIACKYISKPALIDGRKFDLRFIVLVKSFEPFEAYVYNVFWIRFANKQFTLTNLDDYETHFTVMNYTPGAVLTQVSCEQFIEKFDVQSSVKWPVARDRINKAMGATLRAPAHSIAFPRGTAVYGFDVMLTSDMNPQILECNFGPDCTRACKYHPYFVCEEAETKKLFTHLCQ